MKPSTSTPRNRNAEVISSATLAARSPQLTRGLLCLTCFLSGAMTLIIEIAGARLLAPIFGSSFFTWTAIIGVVLVAMSLGDYLGGVLVDRAPRLSLLGYLLLAASSWTLLVPAMHAGLRAATAGIGLIAGPLLVSLVLFAIPACLLAAVSPFVVRLLSRTTDDREIGLSAGLVGMLTTLGSFVGTLTTGFYLIPACGVRMIFFLAGLLAGTLGFAVLVWCRAARGPMPAVAIAATTASAAILAFTPTPVPAGVVHQEQTLYHDLRVEEATTEHGEEIRSLRLDTTLEGGQYVETGKIYMTCNLYWRLAEIYCPRLDRGLFLGGGGFAMPEDFSRRHPDARCDVCEIDPAVIDVGRRFFRLNEFPNVSATAGDARRFLANCRTRYDFIFGDAYQGVRHIPPHLITREFFALVKSCLKDDGVFLMNIISPARGEQAKLLHSILETLHTEFPYTQGYAVNASRPAEPQNVIVMAAAREPRSQARPAATEDIARFLLSTRLDVLDEESRGAAILTDDHNPADWIITEQLFIHPPEDL